MHAPSEDILIRAGCDADTASSLRRVLSTTADAPPSEVWQHLTQRADFRAAPFAAHDCLRSHLFSGKGSADVDCALWLPDSPDIRCANLTRLIEQIGVDSFEDLHAWSLNNRASFWQRSAELVGLRFEASPTAILAAGDAPHHAQWFAGGRLNVVVSCFKADAEAPAVIESDAAGELRITSYRQLHELACRVSNGLSDVGLGRGDAVAIVMPMNLTAVAIYLGSIQAGLVVASIPDSFAWPQIKTRLQLSDARLIFSVDRVQRGDRVLDYYDRLQAAEVPIVVDTMERESKVSLRSCDMRFDAFLSAQARFTPVVCDLDDTINILFSSGTTGEPKAIPWTHLSPLKCASDGLFYQDIHPGDVCAWPTNLGWMMGPWLIFATLMNNAAMALYTDAPTTHDFGRFLEAAHVNRLGVIPSIVRQWRTSQCMEGLDLTGIELFSSTGECSTDQDMFYLMYLAGYRPIIEYCGGTEIAGGYLTSTVLHPNVPGAFSTPALGAELVILDDSGREATRGEGYLVPPAVGLSERLLNADHEQVYYADTPTRNGTPLRRHGDFIQRNASGYYRVEGRADDAMNLGGIKVSSREIEEAVETLDDVLEAAAVAVTDHSGGPARLVVIAVPAAREVEFPEKMRSIAQRVVRAQLNPLFKVDRFVWTDALPRTASQKIMRRRLRDQLITGHCAELNNETDALS